MWWNHVGGVMVTCGDNVMHPSGLFSDDCLLPQSDFDG